MSRPARAHALSGALMLACLLAYFLWFIDRQLVDLGPKSLLSGFDYQSYFRPRFWLGSEELRAFRLPLWNPYEWAGMPLLATGQPAALYPPKVLFYLLLPPLAAHWAFLVFHYVLLTGGFYVFLRDQRLTGPGLFVGMALIVFGTPLLASNYHPVRIACLCYMPLEFYLAERVGRDGSRLAFAWLSFAVFLQLLAGYPEFSLDTGFLLAVHATASYVTGRWKRPPWKTVPWLAAAFVLGGIAAAAQLVPLGELAAVARRVALADHVEETPEILKKMPIPLSVVPGLIVFTAVGFFQKRARTAAAGLTACWIVAGGGWRALRFLPGFAMVRFPLGWVLLALYFFAWIGAVGCDSISTPEGLGPKARRWAQVAVALSGLVLAGTSLYAYTRAREPGGFAFYEVNLGNEEALFLAVAGGLWLTAVAALSILGRTLTHAWFGPLALIALSHIAGVPHGSAPSPFEPPAPHGLVASLHPRSRAVQGRTVSTYDILYGYEVTDRLPSALGIELSFLPHRQRRIMETLRFIPTLGALDWMRVLRAKGFLDAMNVEYVVSGPTLVDAFARTGMFSVAQSGPDVLFRNAGRMGSAWVSYGVRTLADPERALSHVLGPTFDPHREVVLEVAPKTHYEPPSEDEPPARPVKRVQRSPTDIEYVAELDRPGVLVMSDAAYPGWEATVNGAPSAWLQANYVLRAVELPKGRHRVRFQYRPRSVAWGFGLSFVGLLGMLGAFIRARRDERDEKRPNPEIG